MTPEELLAEPYDLLPPEAGSTFEGHRSFGYSLATAVADLIDNSITAQAENVWVDFEWDGPNSTITVTDNGKGMSEPELVAAMRLGSRHPQQERAPHDLGRFGLGLKTASLSQCRRFTVQSRRSERDVTTRCWDLGVIETTGDWRLLRTADPVAAPCFLRLSALAEGTAVVWQDLDRVTAGTATNSDADHQHFLQRIEEVRTHLGLVFHRIIRGPRNQRGIQLIINGHEVEPWDPFLEDVAATYALAPTSLRFANNAIVVQPFVLPHLSKLPNERHVTAAGPYGWNGHQGFYIYRNKRLLVAGDWLGFWPRQDLYRLARIRVDLPNSMDHHWHIDITKSRATPPSAIRADLKRIGTRTRQEARQVYAHRGAQLTPRTSSDRTFLWEPRARHDKTFYRLNLDHPLSKRALSTTSDTRALRALFKMIEETIPLPHIVLETNTRPDHLPLPFEGATPQAREVMDVAYRSLVDSGYGRREALNRLKTLWPFELFPELLDLIAEASSQ